MSLSCLLFHHVIDNLWLGNVYAIDQDVDIIINASQTRYQSRPSVVYHHIDVDDSPDADISRHFDDVYDIIRNNPDKKVLIHFMG